MQASKIIVNQTYALRLTKSKDARDPVLVRYEVSAVVTRRHGRSGSPHDFTSTVEGYIIAADIPKGWEIEPSPGGNRNFTDRIFYRAAPDSVVGPYEETVELRDRRMAEAAAAKAIEQEKTRRQLAVRDALYRLCRINDVPVDASAHKQMFRTSYGHDISISVEGIEALYRALVESRETV